MNIAPLAVATDYFMILMSQLVTFELCYPMTVKRSGPSFRWKIKSSRNGSYSAARLKVYMNECT